jgi:hypothetical protein
VESADGATCAFTGSRTPGSQPTKVAGSRARRGERDVRYDVGASVARARSSRSPRLPHGVHR